MDIIVQSTELKEKSEEVTLDEAKKIAKELFKVLANHPTGYFLSANQIGIRKRVGVVNVRKPLLFINPKIIKSDVDIDTVESNLSFPNKIFQTRRKKIIAVDADNYDKTIIFGSDSDTYRNDESIILEATMVQAMIDMMDGILPQERYPVLSLSGSQILIQRGKKQKVIKAKNFNRYKNLGWKLKIKN